MISPAQQYPVVDDGCARLRRRVWAMWSRLQGQPESQVQPETAERPSRTLLEHAGPVQITTSAHWYEGAYELPATISFTVTANVPNTEIHPCFSASKRDWGSRGGADGLTWYLATHRHDFTFRTEVFGSFPRSRRLCPGRNVKVGVPYKVVCQIDRGRAIYCVGREGEACVPYAECDLSPRDVPQTGSFGFVTYDREKSCTVRDVRIEGSATLATIPPADAAAGEEARECPVCFETPTLGPARTARSMVLTRCGHTFCYGCLATICGQSGGACPVCRAPVRLGDLRLAGATGKAAAPAAPARPAGHPFLPMCSCGKPISRRDPKEGVGDHYCPMSPDGHRVVSRPTAIQHVIQPPAIPHPDDEIF